MIPPAGVTRISRKVIMKMKPTMEVKVEGDQWTIINDSPIAQIVWTFQLGKEVLIRGMKGKAWVSPVVAYTVLYCIVAEDLFFSLSVS